MRRNESGSMLIIALWTLAILSLLALGAGTSAWTEIKLTSLQLDELRAERLLQGGLELAKQTLNETTGKTVTSFGDGWANKPAFFQNANLLEGCFSMLRPNTVEPAFGLEDEQGRLNINTAPPAMLLNLLGDDQETLVNAIVAWRGLGSQPDSLDSQNDFYQSLPHPYECKQAPLESVEELLLIKGMTPALFEKIRPWVTVYTNGFVNMNTAPRPVLLALGFSESLADKIIQHRLGPDGEEGTEDDRVFMSAAGISADLAQDDSLEVDDAAALSAAQPLLTVRSNCFRAHFVFSSTCNAKTAGSPTDVILAASGLSGQWIIKHFSTL